MKIWIERVRQEGFGNILHFESCTLIIFDIKINDNAQGWKMAIFVRFFPRIAMEAIFVSFWCLILTTVKEICDFLRFLE